MMIGCKEQVGDDDNNHVTPNTIDYYGYPPPQIANLPSDIVWVSILATEDVAILGSLSRGCSCIEPNV